MRMRAVVFTTPLTPLPPWELLGGGAGASLVRTITRTVIDSPQDYAACHRVSRRFHSHVRCSGLVFADAVRRRLVLWQQILAPASWEHPFVVWSLEGRLRVSPGPATCSRRFLLNDMVAWLSLRVRDAFAGTRDMALRMRRACRQGAGLVREEGGWYACARLIIQFPQVNDG